jgi:hypothetical protein
LAAGGAIGRGEQSAEIPFDFEEGSNWIQAHGADLQRSVELNLLLDTGASVSALDLGLVRRSGLPCRRPTGSIPRWMADHRPASRPWGEEFLLAPVK